MADIEIEIDGKILKAKPNCMVIQVADEAGIYIPRFCYHKHLTVAANCRMCLVEVDKVPKTLPACATPVAPGMKVFTRSAKAIAAQKAVMEFLLINHPLDCPICDQGGECELQDLSLGYGSAESYFVEGKRAVADEDIGPLVETEMTRCIQCTRCVRFGDEVAGLRELGAVNRGEHMEISTYVGKSLQSEVSGNIIDLCPVGALTSKPYRFTARPWELNQYQTIAPHDCFGSNIYAHTRTGKVMRVVPHENVGINETWISDRDRFSYEGLYHADRLTSPMIRVDDVWQKTDWQTALEFALVGLQHVLEAHGSDQVGVLASPNSTVEEFYLLQKMMRQLGISNIDHRLRQSDFSDQDQMPLFPGLSGSIVDIENADVILLIGSNIQKEQPLASLRVRKATLKGAKVIAVNMMDYRFNFDVSMKKIAAPHDFVKTLSQIVKEKDEALSAIFAEGKKVAVLVGIQSFNHPEAAQIRALASEIARKYSGMLGFMTEGANAAGAWLSGAVPHRGVNGATVEAGLDAKAMWENPRKAYFLMNVEPDLDCANAHETRQALNHAEFVVGITMFTDPTLQKYASVMLPMAAFTETSGTYVNVQGDWQTFTGVANAVGEARPAWKILRVLGNLFHLEGFDYNNSEEILLSVTSLMETCSQNREYSAAKSKNAAQKEEKENGLSRIGEVPIYSGDSLVRRARALQETQLIIEGQLEVVRLHPKTAAKFLLSEQEIVLVKQDSAKQKLPVIIDSRIPEDAAYVACGLPLTSTLGDLFGSIEIEKL